MACYHPSMIRRTLAPLLLAAFAVSAFAAPPKERQQFPPLEIYDLNGQPFALKDFLGAVTVLNFWATWCGPCRLELPELEKLYNELGAKGLAVLAIDVDGPPFQEEGVGHQLEMAKPRIEMFLQHTRLGLPIYVVDGRTQVELGLGSIPFTVLLDREGRAVQAYRGYSPEGMQNLRQLALGLLSEQPQGGK
jgi:thiol-disulfide isomerase/thioredoxin